MSMADDTNREMGRVPDAGPSGGDSMADGGDALTGDAGGYDGGGAAIDPEGMHEEGVDPDSGMPNTAGGGTTS